MDCVDLRAVANGGFGARIVDSDDESRGKGAGSDGGFVLKGAVKADRDDWVVEEGLSVGGEDPR